MVSCKIRYDFIKNKYKIERHQFYYQSSVSFIRINFHIPFTSQMILEYIFSDIIGRFFSQGHRIMYVGADLSHPAPNAGNQTSVAAVVASADDIPNRYFKEVYKQHRPS